MKYHSPSQSVTGIFTGFCSLQLNLKHSLKFHVAILGIMFFSLNFGTAYSATPNDYHSRFTSVEELPLKKQLKTNRSSAVPCFNLVCNDLTFNLSSGECGVVFDFLPELENNCQFSITIMPLDTTLYKFGQLLHIGFHQICFVATDPFGNSATCCINVTINPEPNPSGSLVCHSEVQISLNQNCFATIGADDILAGGPYRCFDDYKVEIRDWYTNELIDRDPNLIGSQVGKEDIGHQLKVTIRDTIFKNSCWAKVTVEDKIPPRLICPSDTSVRCGRILTTPDCVGIPVVIENCGTYTLSYYDDVTHGTCAVGYQEQIKRVWTAIDEVGNKSTCTQIIRVEFAALNDVDVPLNYNDFDKPSLACDEKINTSQDYTSHFLAFPYCVDGYLLDSAHWYATGGYLPSPDGDLAGERLPRVLGWNCIDTGIYAGHPSPYPVYYPAHPEWNNNNKVCWGPDQVVMWLGTGVPEGGNCLNLSLNFQDLKIDLAKPNCDAGNIGCYKILRTWTVLDWCTGQFGGHSQIIKVADKKAPSVLFPDSVLVNMEEFSCDGKFIVPKPWLTDNCSNDIHYYVIAESGFVIGDETSGYIVTNIKPGIWNNYIVAEDCCGNVSRYRFVITAIDNVPPTPVCDKVTVVSLNTNQVDGQSFGQVFAKDLDQASWDNCSAHLFFKVIRMEQLRGTNHGSAVNQIDNGTNCAGVNGDDFIGNGNQIFFDDYARFCCNDVGKTIRVVLRVFDRETGDGPINPGRMNNNGDLAGHFNDCMVDIQVQDKTLPTVTAPPDIVVSCSFWFDIDKISKPDDATFGRVVTEIKSRKKVITKDVVCHNYCTSNAITGYPGYIPGASQSNPPVSNKACSLYNFYFDTSHFDRIYDLLWGFDGTVIGACGTNFSIAVNDNRECGQGRISRTIVALGPNGTSVTATQTIWVVDCDPFYINGNDHCDPDDDITWPGNCTGIATTIDGCGADISPDNPALGRPVIENNADDLCSLVSIEFVDEVFNIETDACFKVVRKWTVIDWCQYDPLISSTTGRWEYLQVIKVHDVDKPAITITMGNCYAAVKNPNDNICYGYLQIKAEATDNCSPVDWLSFDYKIDLYNDGKGIHNGYDFEVGSLSQKSLGAGRKPYIHDNPYAQNPTSPFDASGVYPLGIHKVCWYVEDGCGNIAVNCKLFEIKDCKRPTPYCNAGLITTVMPSTECITIWARDFDAGSYDNCTDSKHLKIYFENNNADSLAICCDEFVKNKVNTDLTIALTLCVEDEEGNKDCCKTAVMVQDPQDVCPNVGHSAQISGVVKTMMDVNTSNVDVQLMESGTMKKEIITNNTGQYLFGDLSFGTNKEYVVRPTRKDDPLNGISTADIVKIQRHILGQEILSSPYQWIAADVNKSMSITSADVLEIRKLILGVITKFDKSDSWTFVPSNHPMDLKSPWNSPREATIQVPKDINYFMDFISIKVGDVNNSAIANNISSITTRNQEVLQFEIDSHYLVAGELYKMEFKSRNFKNIAAYQFTLKYNQDVLNYESFESGALQMNEYNFGTQKKNEGILTTSWNAKTMQSEESGTVLFSLLFRAMKNGNLEDQFNLNSQITRAEAYDNLLNAKEISLSVIRDNKSKESGLFELYQNTPNPFNKETMIHFVLPESLTAQLSIYDLTGKVVWTEELIGKKGWNSIKLKRETLSLPGVYYYQLNAGDYTSAKRMVVE